MRLVYAVTNTAIQIVGYLLHWGLFGTLSVQLYLYYLAFPNDRQFIKCLVYGLYIVEFVQTMLITHDSFAMFGYGFGDIKALTDVHFYWLSIPVLGGLAAGVGQMFYAYRIFILSKSRFVPILVTCLSLTGYVAALITCVYSFQAGNIAQLDNWKTSIAISIWCGTSALCDAVIAICMIYFLTFRNTNFRRTRIIVTKLIRLIIETGSVTAIVALLSLVLFLAVPEKSFYVTPGLVMAKLYANTVYMVLNSRIRIMGGRDAYMSSNDMEMMTTMTRDIPSHSTHGAHRTDGVQGQASVVMITKEVFSGDYETSRTNVSHYGSCASLELTRTFLPGQTTGQELGIFCIAVRVHFLSKHHA
ncbi:hypothetical protein EDD18DRAFT_1078693 [Armillaria luteobubalina]|uniref:DUF6534 domain-containing protein n=1 Tax=Armillaria luteobubalina TaxID=153913 RepID=A0AA39PYN9_9AGAR|nr:hypothetical protein EDD18DRAFT_1078693 [Armillaria luteobubalina]